MFRTHLPHMATNWSLRKSGLTLSVIFCLIAIAPVAVIAQNDEPIVLFTNGKNAFDAGQYEQAATRFEQLLDRQLNNPALETESRKYLAVTYLFLNRPKDAETQFLALLNEDPSFSLDPLVFPIDAVDFFTRIKQDHGARLQKIARARSLAEARRKRDAEAKRKQEMEKLRRNVYIRQQITHRSLLVAMLPFGAGQFQNKHKKKGVALLAGQLSLLVGAAVTFGLHEQLRKSAQTPFYDPDTRAAYEKLERGYRVSNQVLLGTFAAAVLYGVIDAIYYLKPKVERWDELEENQIPPQHRYKPKAALTIDLGVVSTGMGVGLQGRF